MFDRARGYVDDESYQRVGTRTDEERDFSSAQAYALEKTAKISLGRTYAIKRDQRREV